MHFSTISVLSLGLLVSSACALPQGTGSDATYNTAPASAATRTLRSRAVDTSAKNVVLKRTTEDSAIAEEMDRIIKRSGTFTIDPSCNGAPPRGSKYGSGFPDMKSIINRAFTEAMTLASGAAGITAGDVAFQHYFSGPAQLPNVQNMMSAISLGASVYSVNFVCAATQNTPPCTPTSLAVTDATVATGPTDTKTIVICPLFFTSASTKFFLYDASQPNGVPFRDNTGSGWCNTRQNADFFVTAGHTILHELTHLDAVGAAAGLQPDANNQHGTDDFQSETELLGARAYLATYNADTSLPSPEYNAESLAAAATELYFSNLCGFASIRP